MSLYNKYRPRTFEDFIGKEQKKIAHILKKSISAGNTPNTLLFYGEHGSGKTSMAQVVARALNCKNKQNPPCNSCENCRKDPSELFEVINASDLTGVDSIREVIEDINKASLFDYHRVIIFDEMHNLSKQAQDCLLTTAENPPEGVTIILCTTVIKKVNKTLRSRALGGGFYFPTPTREEILQLLSRIHEKETGKTISVDVLSEEIPVGTSVRQYIGLLESYLCGATLEQKDASEGVTEPWKAFVQELVRGARFNRASLSDLLKKMRKDPITSRSAITEYLHSVLINSIANNRDKTFIHKIKKCIEILCSHRPEDMPAILTVDLLDTITVMRG